LCILLDYISTHVERLNFLRRIREQALSILSTANNVMYILRSLLRVIYMTFMFSGFEIHISIFVLGETGYTTARGFKGQTSTKVKQYH
jgi:hypothetical protein